MRIAPSGEPGSFCVCGHPIASGRRRKGRLLQMNHENSAVVTRILERDAEFGTGAARGDLITKWLPATARRGDNLIGAAADGSESRTGEAETVLVVASLEEEDRAGDVVLASGWELGAFEANPVVLWAHDYGRPAIGKAVRIWVEGNSLLAQIRFASTPFAREVRALYLEGFMRGISVGFRALETERRDSSTGGSGILFKRQELLEISAAPVPLNPAALARRDSPRSGDAPEQEASLSDVRDLWSEVADVVA